MDIQVYSKGSSTIKNLMVAPKDKDTSTHKSGLIYRYTGWSVMKSIMGSLQGPLGKDFRNILGPFPLL